MDVLTGTAIAKLAFDEFIKSGAGELAKKSVGGAIEQLRSTIKNRFAGKNDKAEAAIATLEADSAGSIDKSAALNELSGYLDDDLLFAENLQQLAQQVINIGKQEQHNATFNIEAKDNARVNAINELNATTVNFGDQRP
jgi:hypothetical protein